MNEMIRVVYNKRVKGIGGKFGGLSEGRKLTQVEAGAWATAE